MKKRRRWLRSINKLKESMKIEKRKQIEQRLQDKEKQRKLKYMEMKEMQSRSRSVMNKKPVIIFSRKIKLINIIKTLTFKR